MKGLFIFDYVVFCHFEFYSPTRPVNNDMMRRGVKPIVLARNVISALVTMVSSSSSTWSRWCRRPCTEEGHACKEGMYYWFKMMYRGHFI